ncbi:MAG: hypothetical protein EBU88_07015 [Acidobacteria bacterium]|nr:hypothetical protein [Acidobacteriota bacterium]
MAGVVQLFVANPKIPFTQKGLIYANVDINWLYLVSHKFWLLIISTDYWADIVFKDRQHIIWRLYKNYKKR